uniref:Uncharacterized protein n=1 Tax=Sphaerodactylus townsendi TaxID=933632 RepID=A0ACB8GA78_9SAUR
MLQFTDHLLYIQTAELVTEKEKFSGPYSSLFVMPKKNQDWRVVLYLKPLNRLMRRRQFFKESLLSIVETLQVGDFLGVFFFISATSVLSYYVTCHPVDQLNSA